MDILDGDEYGADEGGSIAEKKNELNEIDGRSREDLRFVVVPLGADPVKQFSAGTQVETEVEIVGSLEM